MNTKKSIKKRLSSIWSMAIRTMSDDTCDYCGIRGTESHHIFTRAIEPIQFSILNGISLCSNCHTDSSEFSAHLTPDKFMEWIERIYPKRMETLRKLKRENKKHYLSDLEEIEKELLKIIS